MPPRPDRLLTPTHWLVAAGIAGAAHLAALVPGGAGHSVVEQADDTGVMLDLRVTHAVPTQASAAAVAPATAPAAPRPSPSAIAPSTQRRPALSAPPASTAHAPQDDYLTALQQWLVRFRTYPEAAQRRGWEGTVELSFSIDAQGRVQRARTTRSSGVALLDNAAFELLERASPLPAPPPADAPLRDTVPVAYQMGMR